MQKHAASHLHYDFRLEQNGVLLSWAIPKGPSLDPADKRLAMHVEDHPLDYGGFEGVIPKGEYGGGTVMVWDRGTWTPEGDPVAGYAKGELKFTLDGEKLKGGWVLVRTRGSKYGGKTGDKAWLLIKERDAYARPRKRLHRRRGAAERDDRSRSRRHRKRQRDTCGTRSSRPRKTCAPARSSRPRRIPRAGAKADGARVAGGKKAPMPASIAPVLATLVDRAPAGDDWLNEIKYDGYRMICRIERRRARLVSRNGKDWTHAFPTVARDLAALPVASAWIDGEVVVLDAEGRSSFQALQNALTGAPAAASRSSPSISCIAMATICAGRRSPSASGGCTRSSARASER